MTGGESASDGGGDRAGEWDPANCKGSRVLVEYGFEEYVDYLVVALLPEDAQAFDADYERVSNI